MKKILIVGVLTVISLLTYFSFFWNKPKPYVTTQVVPPNQNTPTAVISPQKLTPENTYEVFGISPTEITLVSYRNAKLTLPRDDRVIVRNGVEPDDTEASMNDLKEGQTVKIIVIPEEKAWVYIIE